VEVQVTKYKMLTEKVLLAKYKMPVKGKFENLNVKFGLSLLEH